LLLKQHTTQGTDVCIMVWQKYTGVGHGTLSPIFMIKVMVRYFVSDTHKLMTIRILVMLVFVFTATDRKEILGRLLFANLHPLVVADKVSGQSCHCYS
jgi:hypothetical protein